MDTASPKSNKTANITNAEGASALSEALKVNTTLTALNLKGLYEQQDLPSLNKTNSSAASSQHEG